MTYIAYLFPEFPAQNTLLHQCLKSCVSQIPLTDNMANGSKHCYNLNGSSFTIFINHCESSCIGKSLF